MRVLTSNLNPHLIRPIQKNPREKVEYLEVRNLISFLKPNLNFLYFSALKQCAIFKDIIILFVTL